LCRSRDCTTKPTVDGRLHIINRIPDLIAAAPGFTTTEKMPTNAFRARDLSFYV
jgi:hypothetical protein